MIEDLFISWKEYTLSLFQNWEIKSLLIFVVHYLSVFTGLPLALLYVFLAALLLDFILGVTCALRFKLFSFSIFKKGVSKIVLYVFYIILMSFGDKVFHEIFMLSNERHYLVLWLAGTIILTELLSILGHCKMLGLPIPTSMHFILSKARETLDCSALKKIEKENINEMYNE